MNENKSLKNQVENATRKIEILGSTWVTDDSIATYLDILSLKVLGLKNKTSLVNPVITEFVKETRDINAILDPLLLGEKDILLIPINEAKYSQEVVNSYKTARGSHWTLLVVDMLSKKSFFYDSILNSGSVEIAKSISPKLSRYFNFPAVAEF